MAQVVQPGGVGEQAVQGEVGDLAGGDGRPGQAERELRALIDALLRTQKG
ncbi:hypothetical protein ACSNOI_23480 [Actinomadura kijaniata]